VIMLAIVPSRSNWVRHHVLELVIVFATFPILIKAAQPIRLLRLLRVMRLLRLAPLVRYAFSMEGVRFAAILALLTAVAGGAGFASVEKIPVGDGIYWAITTMTTVGYGDITPKTTEGKIVAIVVMLIGIGVATLFIGAVADKFLSTKIHAEAVELEADEAELLAQVRDISARLNRLEQALEQRAQS
jgi:voltage-gated potassium channel